MIDREELRQMMAAFRVTDADVAERTGMRPVHVRRFLEQSKTRTEVILEKMRQAVQETILDRNGGMNRSTLKRRTPLRKVSPRKQRVQEQAGEAATPGAEVPSVDQG